MRSGTSTLGTHLKMLLRQGWEVWPCRRKYVVQAAFDHSLDPFLVCSLCFVLVVEDVSSQLPA